MVLSIARQSVIIKCCQQKSIMLGNYEFYYAAGLLSNITKVEIDEGLKPQELKVKVDEVLTHFNPTDDREKHLTQMLHFYHPEEVCNEQTEELFVIGKNEKNLWVENPHA